MSYDACAPDQVLAAECYCRSEGYTCYSGAVCHDSACVATCTSGYAAKCMCGSTTYGATQLALCTSGQQCDTGTGECKACSASSLNACNCGGSYEGRCRTCRDAAASAECASCLQGYYLTESSTCAACQYLNCAACLTAARCDECAVGYQNVMGICVPYPQGCAEIDAQGRCVKCVENSYSEGRPGVDLQCQACSGACAGCVKGNRNGCLECAENAIPRDIYVPKNCAQLACLETDWANEKCTACSENYYLSTNQTKSSYSNCRMCPATPLAERSEDYLDFSACNCGDQYENCGACAADGGCRFCKSGYRAGPRRNSCDQCDFGFDEKVVNGKLVCEQCADGFFPSRTAKADETGRTRVLQCSECNGDLNVQNQDCNCAGIANCYVCNAELGICEKCRFGYAGSTCSDCRQGYEKLKDGTCAAVCRPEALRNDECCGVNVTPMLCPANQSQAALMRGSCKCGDAVNCLNCAGNQCAACLPGFKLRNGACDTCNDDFWQDGARCARCPRHGDKVPSGFRQCVCAANANCLNCRDDKVCGECVRGFALREGVCIAYDAQDYETLNIVVGCIAGILGVLGVVAVVAYCLRLKKPGYEQIEDA